MNTKTPTPDNLTLARPRTDECPMVDVTTQRTFVEDLLRPRSVAIVGASDDPRKTTSRPQRFLREAGYEGTVYPVNPGREQVLGEKAWPSLESLPEVPDHVYILTNTELAIEAVRECGRVGVRVATVLASGFGEEGPEGLERQERLREVAREGGVRLVGPSSMGVVNPRNGMFLTTNAVFVETDFLLHDAGVPAFRTPESCADVVASALKRRRPTIQTATSLQRANTHTGRVLDEVASGQVLVGQGVRAAPTLVLDIDSIDDELDVSFGYPVVVKALSDQLPHKTEAGGVVLGVQDAEGLRAAVRQIVSNVAAFDSSVVLERVVIQQMVPEGVAEALIGYRVSPSVGPLVLLAAGGIHTELYSDSTLRLAPVDADTAARMIDEVRGLGLLKGFRGAERGDVEALIEAIVSVSRLAVDRPEVLEAEINPLTIGVVGGGAIALDALVRVEEDAHSVSESEHLTSVGVQ